MATTSEISYRPVFRWDDDCGNSYGPESSALDDAFDDAQAMRNRLAALGMVAGQVYIEQTTTTTTTSDVMSLPRA